MITSIQLSKLIQDYGPLVAIVVVVVGFFFVAAALWKPLSKFVLAINTVLLLPATLEAQDKDSAEKRDIIVALDQKIGAHIVEADKNMITMTELQREVRALGQQQMDIIHEVKPNSGSSMNDALKRTEAKAEKIEKLLGTVLAQMETIRVNKVVRDAEASGNARGRAGR